ncbi:MAG: response regulator [Nitrospirota bacterium]
MKTEKRILIAVDDNELKVNLLETLGSKGYLIETASDEKAAISIATKNAYDIVLLKLMIKPLSNMKVLMEVRKFQPKTRIIIIGGSDSIYSAVEAMKLGASHYISIPFIKDDLVTTIRRCLEEARFDTSVKDLDLDFTIYSLSSPIRRKIIKVLRQRNGMNLMEITRTLNIKAHTKVLFHLKMLQDSAMISHDDKKDYVLTAQGGRTLNCLDVLENVFVRKTNGAKGIVKNSLLVVQ